MQTVILLPPIEDNGSLQDREERLFRKVGGIPLLQRVIATALKSGANSVLLLLPEAIPDAWLRARLESPTLGLPLIETKVIDSVLDPWEPAWWRLLESQLEPRFLWLPWNYVTVKKVLAPIISGANDCNASHPGMKAPAGIGPPCPSEAAGLAIPVVLDRERVLGDRESLQAYVRDRSAHFEKEAGIVVTSGESRRRAERLIVRGSGKPTDGIYSKFNRRLCWPAVRWVLKTPITANMVTWIGLPLVMLSGYSYAQGYWSAYALGGLIYFLSVLLDEMDGMLARSKFQESPFGCWLETFVDYAGYLFLWLGIAVGLYREYDSLVWLWLGGATILLNLITFWVLARQRTRVVPSDRPEQYQRRFYGRLESDSASLVSRAIRKIVFLAKKGVMCHYVLLSSVLGLLPLLFALAVFGSTLTLMISLHMNRLFRLPGKAKGEDWRESIETP